VQLRLHVWAVVVVLLVYMSFAIVRLGTSELGSDEGRFGVSAVNLLHNMHQFAVVSEDPLGPPGTKPFGYPLLLAASILVFGKTVFALRIANVIVLMIGALFLYGFVALVVEDRTAALLTFAFFLLNPGTVTYARSAMPEPLVVAAGCFGLFCVARFITNHRLPWAAACGFAIGLGFLSKLWLVLPFAMACFSVFALQSLRERKRVLATGTLLACASFGFVAASHLFLVLCLAPGSWQHWMGIYFLFSVGSRMAGHGYDPAMWYRPWWFYLAALVKASFFGLPLLLLGIHTVWKQRQLVVITVVCSLLLPVLAFSFFRVKQASYIYPVHPALALLIALGWIYFKDADRVEQLRAFLIPLGAAAFLFFEHVFSVSEFTALASLCLLYFTAGVVGPRISRQSRYAVTAALFSALLIADARVANKSFQQPLYFSEIAEFFRPQLQASRPQDLVFTAPIFPAMEFYTFRSGEYWQTFYVHKSFAQVTDDLRRGAQVFYIVDPLQTLYGSEFSPDKLEALREYGVDVTRQIEQKLRHPIPLRIFVPRAAAER